MCKLCNQSKHKSHLVSMTKLPRMTGSPTASLYSWKPGDHMMEDTSSWKRWNHHCVEGMCKKHTKFLISIHLTGVHHLLKRRLLPRTILLLKLDMLDPVELEGFFFSPGVTVSVTPLSPLSSRWVFIVFLRFWIYIQETRAHYYIFS